MIEICPKDKCTGCTACYSNCSHDAITMITDNMGFKCPMIDEKKCINCGLCQKTCPILNTSSNASLNQCYVGYNKNDDEKNKASSGAIFSLIAERVIDEGGVVIGAAFDEDMCLKHIMVDNKDDLEKLKRSKYLQSDLNNIIQQIKESIQSRKVLFVGTPCQVAGVKAVIKNSKNLICIDLFCHGVPAPKLFEKYTKEIEDKYNDKITDYNFRDKATGWDSYSNTVIMKNNKYSQLQSENDYMRLFLSDVALRESCFSCNFKLGNKYSDITLGDFWGVKNIYPDMYNKKGVSAIIINTNSGNCIFNEIKDKLEYKTCNLNDILKGNPLLERSCALPAKREQFLNDFDYLTVNSLRKKYTKKKSFIKKVVRKCISILRKK